MSGFKKKQRKLARRLSMPLMLLLCFQMSMIYANNLGVEGSVYQIVEPDMLIGIYEKLEAMQKSGALERQKQQIIKRSIQHVLRPTPVRGVSDLQKGQTPRQHYFDPTLIFIDGDSADQLHWMNHFIKSRAQQQKRFKIILVKGDINEAAKALHRRVYFDQDGGLCHHFNITHTPTRVFQPKENNGTSNVLLVQEVQVD